MCMYAVERLATRLATYMRDHIRCCAGQTRSTSFKSACGRRRCQLTGSNRIAEQIQRQRCRRVEDGHPGRAAEEVRCPDWRGAL